ncbi:MAG: TlpA family protein disulfide reductase [Anaerolineales bacterium]|nr:TlpA family protein disulfide reductase [Anaerolineales bacterium]
MIITKTTSRREQLRAARRRSSRRSALILMLAGLGLVAGAAWALSGPAPATVSGRAKLGSPMPSFALRDLSGRAVSLSELAGQVVLVNGWATWCPPCRAEMPALHAFYQAHQAEGFTLLAVNAGEEQAAVSQFIDELGFTFPVLLDPGVRVLNGLGIDAFPTSILVGRDGLVKQIHIGYYAAEDLAAEVLPLLR